MAESPARAKLIEKLSHQLNDLSEGDLAMLSLGLTVGMAWLIDMALKAKTKVGKAGFQDAAGMGDRMEWVLNPQKNQTEKEPEKC